jgi:hypothetical protein
MNRWSSFGLVLSLLLIAACGDGSTTPGATSSPEATQSAAPTSTPRAGVTATLVTGTSTPLPPQGQGVAGVALIGPTCPVQRIDSPCPDRPFEGVVVVRNAAGLEVARTMTDAQGRFSISLAPGRYVLTTLVTGVFPAPATQEVTVTAGQVIKVDLHLDSGIR